MATLYAGYAVPSSIAWVDGDSDAASRSFVTSSRASVRSGGSSFKVHFVCRHYTYQYQYRVRRRYSPAYAFSLGLDGTGAEVWEDWGEWRGNDLSDEKSKTTRLDWGKVNLIDEVFDFGYDFSQYDKIEYQFRIRAFDEPTHQCSEWGYQTLSVIYEPIAEIKSAVRQANGDVLLSVESNWLRGGNRFTLKNTSKEKNPPPYISQKAINLTGVPSDFEVTVPYSMVRDASRVYAYLAFWTSDNSSSWGFAERWFDVGEHEAPDAVPEPSVSFEDDGIGTTVEVMSGDGAYSNVFVSASWEDPSGKTSLVELDMENDGGSWVACFDAAPFDVPVTYRVAVVNSDGWAYKTVEHTTPSGGQHVWSHEGEHVALMFNVDHSSTFSPEGVAVKTTRERPVARFGIGGSHELSVSGVILHPSLADGTWRSDVAKLRRNHTWTYRKPGGEVCKVLVKSVSDSVSYKNTEMIVSVSVSMTEVD